MVVLGHRRLSIFDLSDAGRQPMMSEDRSVAVVFNGAIYNFRALRVELELAGYAFKSHTDTEVLIHGYREWGIQELIRRLRGMFAFGLWDDRVRKLFLIRDRLGVKPLIYAETRGGGIAFASTVRALPQVDSAMTSIPKRWPSSSSTAMSPTTAPSTEAFVRCMRVNGSSGRTAV
jgi:asparagine synthase (glutamine-hydrolysing)